jgi:hypothetical protein
MYRQDFVASVHILDFVALSNLDFMNSGSKD